MKKRNTHISEEDFKRYLGDKMSEAERNRFERELQKHPFEAEAMEGYENTSVDLKSDLEDIKNRITSKKQKNTYRYWAAAATVLLLVTAGLIWNQLGNEPPTPEMAALETEKQEQITSVAPDSVREEVTVSESESEEKKEETTTEPATKEKTAAEIQQQQQQQVAAVAEPESGEQKPKEKPMAQNRIMAAKNREVKSARDTKTVSFDFTTSKSVSNTQLKMKSLTSTENETIALTENVEFPIDSNDIFPDSFQTIPAEERERIQEIQGVAIQDQVELEGDPYLTDIAVRPKGGMENFMNYIEKQAVLPEKYPAKKETVKLLLNIDEQGKVVNIQSRNKTDSLLFERSKKIIQNGPDWNPKILNGERIQSEVKLKIIFKKK